MLALSIHLKHSWISSDFTADLTRLTGTGNRLGVMFLKCLTYIIDADMRGVYTCVRNFRLS